MAKVFVSLASKHPELVPQWHPTKNTTTPDLVSRQSGKKAWWVCAKGHEWETKIANRANGRGCQLCTGRTATADNNAAKLYPELVSQWHPTKNTKPLEAFTAKSNQKLWWVCVKGHEWEAEVFIRTRGLKCPYCSKKRPSSENNLALIAPQVAAQWHPTKNELKPHEVSPYCNEKAWWLCDQGHESFAVIGNRTKGHGCPYCTGQLPSHNNNLAVANPELAAQWHPTKNELAPTQVTTGADVKVWWRCSKGHDWQAWVYHRSNGQGCPNCSQIHTAPERAVEALLGFPRYNRCPLVIGKQYRPDIQLNDTTFLNVDGLYWHSAARKEHGSHRELRRAFEAEGMRILQFYEDEVATQAEIVKSMVAAVTGKVTNKIAGRQCMLAEFSTKEANEFLVGNHIIGAVKGCWFIGLQFGGQLVSLMAYRLTNGKLEITRYASLLNTIVQGGFQKLLAEVRRRHPGLIIRTLVDLRYADGHSLEKAGFKAVKEYTQYQYTNRKIRVDKRALRVKAGVDETEEARKKGWYRIYDAGRRIYELEPANV